MADVRLLIQEEGRTARNLIAFNVPVGTNSTEKVTRKPPSVPRIVQNNITKRSMKTTTRVRSASTGRDKKSELQARYWAFLFGNLQRAVDGIYQTCEEDENISECKEVIMVLENYTRDFHNLIEWFKVKWAYENSPPPLRRTPLAWEVRKTSPCRTWNSSMNPKSTSPLQRSSPTEFTCRSPIDQMFTENKTAISDNKIRCIKEENVQKNVKDKKNAVSKNDSTIVKEKRNQTLKEKSTLSKSVNKNIKPTLTKVGVNTNHRILSEVNARDTKNKLDNRRGTPDKEVNKSVEINNKSSLHNNSENKPICNMKDMESVKNEINAKVKDVKREKSTITTINNVVKVIDTRVPFVNESAKNNVSKSEKVSSRTKDATIVINDNIENKASSKPINTHLRNRPAYSTISQMKPSKTQLVPSPDTPKFSRSKTSLSDRKVSSTSKTRPGTSVMVRRCFNFSKQETPVQNSLKKSSNEDINGSVEVLTKQSVTTKLKDEGDGWQTVRSRYRRGSSHNLNMSTRFHKPSTATSLPALSIESSTDASKQNCLTPDGNKKQQRNCAAGKAGKNMNNEVEKVKGEIVVNGSVKDNEEISKITTLNLSETNSTSMIAAIFKNDAELLEKRIQQFMAAQAERERIILEEERKTEEADSQRSQQLSDEEASLKRQILELESTEIDIDTETDETDGEMALEIEDEPVEALSVVTDDISLEDRYENMLEGMSWAERVDTLAQLQALVARHPGRALELHQKLSSPSRKRSLPETLRRYQTKQACAQRKRQKLLMEKSQRLRELLNKVEDVKSAKNQLIEDKRIRMEMRLKRAEENRTQHLLEIVRKAHDEDSKLKEIAFINELEAQNKRHDFMALCQEQEERLQGIQEERQRRQEEKAAKEAAAEERRRALEADRQLRIQKMKQARREREERVGKMQLEREKERQELAREKARDREERLSALHAAQLANQEELQKKIAQKQQESARRHVENIEHIRQRAVESSILRSEEVPPTLRSYPAQKQCSLCSTVIPNEVYLLSHLKGKAHLEAVRNAHDGREPSRDELQRFNISQIRDVQNSSNDASDTKATKEKQKALKRRCRKIKQRMTTRGQEWEDGQKNDNAVQTFESANKAKFRRNLKELERLCNNHLKNTWSNVTTATLERSIGEIARAYSKPCPYDQDVFRSLNGFEILTNLLNLGLNGQNASNTLPNKSIISLCRVYKSSINGHSSNIEGVLLSNKCLVILDLLLQRLEALTSLDDQSQVQETASNSTGNGIVVSVTAQVLCALIPEEPFEKASLQSRIQDITGYLVTGGLIERVCRHSRALIETDFFLDQEHESPVLLATFDLLSRLCRHSKRPAGPEVSAPDSSGNGEQSSVESHLLGGLTSSEAAGAVGALYAAVALNPINPKGASPTPNQTTLSKSTRLLVFKALRLLRTIAEIDLTKLQRLLGAEGTSLQWRLIASHVITRLSRDALPEKPETMNPASPTGPCILSELFTIVGYFAVNNSENQLILQTAGAGPSVLQQLCTLPFPFYGDPRLSSYTLPALLAATHENPEAKAALSCELSYELLEEYRSTEEGKLNPLVRLLKDPPAP